MYANLEAFATDWSRESARTLQVLETLTDASLAQRICPERRTLGGLAWHLVTSIQFMTCLGLSFAGPDSTEPPASAAAIAAAYRSISEEMLQAVRTQWNDRSLAEVQTIAGETWANGDTLLYVVKHQAHHRGQMTVLMRQAGLRPPELYGQTYESWVEQGVAPLP